MGKRVLKKFRMTKIDAVRKPAQEGATMVIRKSDEHEQGGNNKIPDTGNGENTMTEQEIQALVEKRVAEELAKQDEPAEPTEADIEKQAEALSNIEAHFAENASDAAVDIYKSMDEDEQMDVLMQYAESPEEVLAYLDEAEDEGAELAKAQQDAEADAYDELTDEDKAELFDRMVMGDTDDAVEEVAEETQDLRKELEQAQEQIAMMQAEKDLVEKARLAEEHFAHLPGTSIEKAQMLSEMEDMSEGTREMLLKSLEASDEALEKGYFQEAGTSMGQVQNSSSMTAEAYAKKAAEIQKANPEMPAHEAIRLAAQSGEATDLYKSYSLERTDDLRTNH